MESVIVATLIAVLATAAYTDLHSSRIPNWLTFPAMGMGIIVHAWTGGLTGTLSSLEGLGVGLGLLLLPHAIKALGAGDVKLMAAVGSMVGPHGALSAAFLSVLVGGFYALGVMSYQWGIPTTGRKLVSATYGAFISRGSVWAGDLQLPFRLRYGLAITGGTLLYIYGVHPFGG